MLEIQFHGQSQATTLAETAMALAHSYASPLAIPVALLIIVCPCLQILLLSWVLFHACRRKAAPGFAPAMRLLAGLAPWSMAEVALLSILIAAIKLSGLVSITTVPHPGAARFMPVIAGDQSSGFSSVVDAENRKGEARMTPAGQALSLGLVRCHVRAGL